MTEYKKAPQELREEERLLKYLSEKGIDPAQGVSEELLARFLTTERSREQFASFFDKNVTVCRNNSTDLKERIGIFLHPRFLDMPNHSDDHHKIKLLLTGRMPLEIDGHQLMMEPGDICFIPPGVDYSRPTLGQDTLLLNIVFNHHPASIFRQIFLTKNPISVFYELSGAPQLQLPYLLCRTGNDPEVRDILNIIYDYKAEQVREDLGERVGELMVEQLLLMLLDRHVEDFSDSWKKNTQGQEIYDILDYVNQNAKTLTLAALAQRFNYSEAYMSRFIKRNTGLSFSELLRSVRLDMALNLLHTTNLPISDIVAEVGYNGKAHFYRVFQAKFGLTPAEMRAKFRSGAV